MKLTTTIAAITLITANAAAAESRITNLCGSDHINEVVSFDDVSANPDGYYIASLKTQISHGDPRIIQATGKEFHLCTRSAATPDMDRTKVLSLMGEREVKYLFIPTENCPTKPSA